MCDPWMVFENFLADMGPRPRGTEINRINNDGNYEPDNCEWANVSRHRKLHSDQHNGRFGIHARQG